MAKAIKANPKYVGKKIRRLDGNVYTIKDVTAKGYVIDGFRRALRAVYVEPKGRGLVELLDHPDPKWADLPNPDVALFDTNEKSTKKPSSKKPSSKKPAAKKPSSKKPAAKKPSSKKQASKTSETNIVDFELAQNVRSKIAHTVAEILSDENLSLQNVAAYYNDDTIQVVVNVKLPKKKEEPAKEEKVERKVERKHTQKQEQEMDLQKGMLFENEDGELFKIDAISTKGKGKVRLLGVDSEDKVIVPLNELLKDYYYVEEDEGEEDYDEDGGEEDYDEDEEDNFDDDLEDFDDDF